MRRCAAALFLFLAGLLTAAFAQTTNATLGGTVTDATGALIPGVTVTSTNTQTGIVTTVVTNETGAYQFASLQTGIYKVTAELPGFQTQAYSDVTLGVAQQVRLNFTLQVGTQTQQVEVSVAADTLIATTSSSVGTVLPEYKLRDLPLPTRNALDLVLTTAGTQGSSFAGSRTVAVNTVRDGVPVSDGRYDVGVSASTYVSPDLVEEVRIIVAPADAELGRGSGQVQMATRSGTNQFRGSLFWTNRNSALSANSWGNNFRNVGKDYKNGNQFGGRLGGPIIKNKTFFFFLYDGQRYLTKSNFIGNVLTAPARQGIFRYYEGVQNGNLLSNNPVVDFYGNPRFGEPKAVSVFGRDPQRSAMDTSGWIQRLLARMPPANDFTVGDGLNTAGHQWLRRVRGQDTSVGDGQDTNRNQYNARIDHNFNSNHKASFSWTQERDWSATTQTGIANWPDGYDGTVQRDPRFFSASLVSTLAPTVLNEFRFGSRRNKHFAWNAIQRPDAIGDEARKHLTSKNGELFFPSHILFVDNYVQAGQTRGQTSPVYSFTDTLAWTRSKHAFKAGFEARFNGSRGYNFGDDPKLLFPTVSIGAGSIPLVGIANNPTVFPGLIGTNITTAQNLLLDLSGSVSNVSRTFYIQKPTDTEFTGLVQTPKDNHQNEWSTFFKDDWKIHPNLTLNLGVRYDYYGVPWEKNGLMGFPIGGNAALYGISGTDQSALWNPYAKGGSLTKLEFTGKHSPNPEKLWYNDDWNNFAPAIGFSWSVPWLGKDKTILRAGYGMSYPGTANFNAGWNFSNPNGYSFGQNFTRLGLSTTYFNLTTLPIPVPSPGPGVVPLAVEPFTQRTASLRASDENRVVPYIQNWNLEIQRSLASNLTLEARYIGSKGTKLLGGIPLNDVNIFENGILDAFKITRAGGDAPLFDQMLRGLVMNTGQSPVGTNGVTGSAALRQNTIFRTFLANGSVGQFANALNVQTTVTNQAGGLIRNGGFPENFIVVNPQFASVRMDTNPGNSTYHSMTLQLTKRLSQGFTNQTSYTWSKTIGESSDDGSTAYLNPRDRSLNKTLVDFHRTHSFRSNGTFELPFGPGRPLLSNASGWVGRLVERWQFGGILSWVSGAPLSITAPVSTFTQGTGNTPVILGNFPKNIGKVTPLANGATYFPGLQQVTDPARASVTTAQGLQNQFSNYAIADAQGNIILANPAPGQLGTLGRNWIEGPSHIGFDVDLVKRVRISETKEFELRVDVINVLNTPRWQDPNTNINSVSFGRLTASDPSGSFQQSDVVTGARTFTINARVNF